MSTATLFGPNCDTHKNVVLGLSALIQHEAMSPPRRLKVTSYLHAGCACYLLIKIPLPMFGYGMWYFLLLFLVFAWLVTATL